MTNHQLKALIFDVDGTIADTEKNGHLPAANDAMKALGLEIQWGWDEFKGWISTIPGNVNRLKHSLQLQGVSATEIEKLATAFAPLKKKIYIEKYLPNLLIRKGIVALMEQAVAQKIQLAIVSTSYESQIKALLQSQLPQFYPLFHPILGKESGKKTDNNGFLHKKCIEELGISAHQAIVIEDAQNGLEAASCANIPTAIFYNDYTFGSDFSGAKVVAPNAQYFSLKDLEKICLN
ncbi:MAG TPA: phosphatase [Phaeodactylibacter sp.]|nr:phosphatase [Phaeodactylibacter sp.]